MRLGIYVAAAVALAAIAPQTLMLFLASAAGIVLESLPYLAFATAIAPFSGRHAHALVAYLGCGCTGGPSARSIPAAIATAALFGLPAAFARVAAASFVARRARRCAHAESGDLLGEVHRLAPAALLAAAAAAFVPMLPLRVLPPVALFTAGALLGAIVSPCALGGIALAASLRAPEPLAAAGVLCTAGILDVYALRSPRAHGAARDRWAYVLLALVCALVAGRGGASLVHPRLAVPLALCALFCLYAAWRERAKPSASFRLLPALLLAVAVAGAPAPVYRATETTLADAFPGEHVDFTGVAVSSRTVSALVRYAIVCCRADAAPVALALDRNVARFNGRWLHASGALESHDGMLRLRVEHLAPVPPPSDPFVYR
ncbi:MAG TPA: hypothetical protein VMF11_16325 [Candidatus Baltobacteraceae bacterium]|nr:hypothetical protein [Candidatus Baltobacteraceae bacterium]